MRCQKCGEHVLTEPVYNITGDFIGMIRITECKCSPELYVKGFKPGKFEGNLQEVTTCKQ